MENLIGYLHPAAGWLKNALALHWRELIIAVPAFMAGLYLTLRSVSLYRHGRESKAVYLLIWAAACGLITRTALSNMR